MFEKVIAFLAFSAFFQLGEHTIELDKRRAQIDKLMDTIISDPDVQKAIINKLLKELSKVPAR